MDRTRAIVGWSSRGRRRTSGRNGSVDVDLVGRSRDSMDDSQGLRVDRLSQVEAHRRQRALDAFASQQRAATTNSQIVFQRQKRAEAWEQRRRTHIETRGRFVLWHLGRRQINVSSMNFILLLFFSLFYCLSLFDLKKKRYLCGTEDGYIHRCSTSYNEQYLDTYRGHTGPVYRLAWSPFLKNSFLSASGDWTIRLWKMNRILPCLTFNSSSVRKLKIINFT